MVEVNENIAHQTLVWLEVLIDTPGLTEAEKAQIQSLINFWRLYNSFTSG